MRITELYVDGFRSLVNFTLPAKPNFNVMYGPNGAGKSNILDAIALARALVRDVGLVTRSDVHLESGLDALTPDDLTVGRMGPIHLRLRVVFGLNECPADLPLDGLSIAYVIDASTAAVRVTSLELRQAGDGEVVELHQKLAHVPFDEVFQQAVGGQGQPILGSLSRGDLALLLGQVARTIVAGLAHIGAARSPDFSMPDHRAAHARSVDSNESQLQRLQDLLAAGRLEEALFHAQTGRSLLAKKRYDKLLEMLSAPPFNRNPVRPVQWFPSGSRLDRPEYGLRELIDGPGDVEGDVDLHRAGLGVYQIYVILAGIVLGGDIVCLEEPEAHLHAPTSGRHLREALETAVETKACQQLFIATHSNLFDLNPDGYWDVSLDDAGHTQVEWSPLSRIDDKHLFEPGPAKHALLGLLKLVQDEEMLAFRTPTGKGVSVREMVEHLQADTETGLSFLRDVNEAAVDTVRAIARAGQRAEASAKGGESDG